MDLEIISVSYYAKCSKSDKDKYMISLIYEILKKMIQVNLYTKQNRPMDIDNKLMVTKEAGGGIN